MNRHKNIKLAGWTLSETLVMMIVAGAVFLAVMDGIVMFGRYARAKTDEITRNLRLYEGYYRLEHLVASADSVTDNGGRLELFRDGGIMSILTQRDSLLTASTGHLTDTLLWGLEDMRLNGADSLLFTLSTSGEPLPISFGLRPTHDESIINLRKQETPYAYE